MSLFRAILEILGGLIRDGTRPLFERFRRWFNRRRMAVSSTTSELSFTGNNSDATAYALTGLRYDAAAWLTVVQIDADGAETTLTDGVEFNLGGTGSTGAGTLTSTTGNEIPVTESLRVTRNVPLTQSTDLENDVPLDHDALETTLDKGTMTDQDLDRRIDDLTLFTPADQTKLAGIETGATADQTGAQIKAAYEAEADTNAFTDADHSKLDGIEAGATTDQSDAEILTAWETATGRTAATDAAKLDGIETGATADQTGAQIKAAYEAEADTNAFTDADRATIDGLGDAASLGTSTGGNGSGDAGKAAVFGSFGGLTGSSSFAGVAGIYGYSSTANAVGVYGHATASGVIAFRAYATNSGAIIAKFETQAFGTLLQIDADKSVTIESDTAENFLAALGIPVKADLTAANADLNAGDIYFDQALGVCRSATA